MSAATSATAPRAARAQEAFEGSIGMRIAAPRPGGMAGAGGGASCAGAAAGRAGGASGAASTGMQEVEYLVRGTSVRINLAGPMGAMALLVSGREKKTWMLLPAQQRYMELAADTSRGAASARAAMAAATVTKTGRTEVVAATRCEVVRVVTPRDTTDVCVARGMGRFLNPLASMRGAPSELPWQRALLDGEGFPLRVTRPDGGVTLEVTRIERKRLPTDLFAIPLEWQKMDMTRRP